MYIIKLMKFGNELVDYKFANSYDKAHEIAEKMGENYLKHTDDEFTRCGEQYQSGHDWIDVEEIEFED